MAQLRYEEDRQGNIIVSFNGKDWFFAGPWKEVYGALPTHIKGREQPIVIGKKPTSALSLQPDNPRISFDRDKIKPNKTHAGQERIKDYLLGEFDEATNDSLKQGADALQASYEFHGGQNEALWTQENVTVEGNRRLAVGMKRGDEFQIVQAFSRETTAEEIFAIVTQQHVGGKMEWVSYARAKEAYRAIHEFGWSMKDVVASMGFSSVRDAEKYIHSFVWYEKSGLDDITHWSKFWHAYIPFLVSHFGYNKTTEGFETNGRKQHPSKKREYPTPVEVDRIAGAKTDFEWFVNLIRDNKVTDCRQSDGIVAPALRDANEPYGPRVLELLQKNPVPVRARPARGRPGKIPAPADIAWAYMREQRVENAYSTSVVELREASAEILRTALNRKPYQENTPDNLLLRTEWEMLMSIGEKMLEILPQREQRNDRRRKQA